MPFPTQPPFPLVSKTDARRRGIEHWTVNASSPTIFWCRSKGYYCLCFVTSQDMIKRRSGGSPGSYFKLYQFPHVAKTTYFTVWTQSDAPRTPTIPIAIGSTEAGFKFQNSCRLSPERFPSLNHTALWVFKHLLQWSKCWHVEATCFLHGAGGKKWIQGLGAESNYTWC